MGNDFSTNLKSRVQKQQKKKIRKIRFYHSFLTIVLLLCVFEISYSAILNLAKIVVYQSKISKAQDLLDQAETRNKFLKNEISSIGSMHRVESIARNNLKMAAKDEVLIIINQPLQEEDPQEETNNKFVQFFEQFSSKFNDLTPEKNQD